MITPTQKGSIRLMRVAGIQVFLHWSWFLVAAVEVQNRANYYTSFIWNVLEYLALFLLVLLHEFGHSLACRQVGGKADQIVLWPLGGVAYVSPPQRPGAMLWSLAAGPLVNLVLVPVLYLLGKVSLAAGWPTDLSNVHFLLRAIWYMNLALLIFNLLPIYPLDGGQILRSLLWFAFGRARSLMLASIVGFGGVILMVLWSVVFQSVWMGILSVFVLLSCWGALRQASALAKIAAAPRRPGFACPSCHVPPAMGAFWMCSQCRTPFDTFETLATCPKCSARFSATSCPECASLRPVSEWVLTPPA